MILPIDKSDKLRTLQVLSNTRKFIRESRSTGCE